MTGPTPNSSKPVTDFVDVRWETKRLSSSSNAWRPFTQTKRCEEEDSPSSVEEEDPPSSIEEEDPPSSATEVLVVQGKGGQYRGTGVWKLPTGKIKQAMAEFVECSKKTKSPPFQDEGRAAIAS
ncbi:PREDICTED: uncharacterized protein LOC107880720 [Prunus mume]|uniref:Uncharacterized protein LOC107880720 n=1 Tax=Prunus mume TaxID=102107 RepID=A0ABM1LLM3_PRUMU|nr:PREDICTED: uncharacterized protein LOC107880720 [Prunus mume]